MGESYKMEYDIKRFDQDDFVIEKKNNSFYSVVIFETREPANFLMESVRVKFLPTKFDNLVVQIDDETCEALDDIRYHALDHIDPIYEFYSTKRKTADFSIKLNSEQKELVLKNLKIGNYINVVISYTGLAYYAPNDMWYPKFILQKIKKVDEPILF